ncbi:MAG: DEAD/DEAH box helicase [Flavobacteriales bacterium]
MTFSELNLREELLEGISYMNFKSPTPIQQQAIPAVLAGRDIMGIAQTGTGKTAAFVLPILNRILELPKTGVTQALIVVPTRELALQIDQAIEGYSYFTGASSIAIYGGGDGDDFSREKQAMKRGVEIIIATPGRLLSHMNIGNTDFTKLRFLVLDEADRMLDMGFQPDLFRIMRALNVDRQTLMFSATMPNGIESLARTFLKDPVHINIAVSKPAEGVKQGAYILHDDQKLQLILHILQDPERADQSIIVFCSRKQSVGELYQRLKQAKLNVGRISSDLEQTEREEVMQHFRSRQMNIIVATDVISRGIDIDNIDMVINYDVPRDAEDYVHRVGRTARAQKKGEAITLVSKMDQSSFQKIEKLIGSTVEKLVLPEKLGPAPEYSPSSGGGSPRGQGGKGRSGKKPFFKGNRNGTGKSAGPQQPKV